MNEISKAVLESIKENPPTVCVECLLFDWIMSPEGITGGKCALDPNISPDEFEYGKLADGCPLRKDGDKNV